MKVVKKVLSVVCVVISKVLHGVSVACNYLAEKAQVAADVLVKE